MGEEGPLDLAWEVAGCPARLVQRRTGVLNTPPRGQDAALASAVGSWDSGHMVLRMA